jgi:3-deoxy-manno-octulosonate cytidylyltransferase (CMP-KDO synthetase)
MTLLTVIPARLGSTRLARKPLRLLGGVPLVVRVYERVASLGIGDAIVVATDDDEVMKVCVDHGIPSQLTSAQHASGTDRVAQVALCPEYAHHQAILNVQGDEPFVSREALEGAVAPILSGVAEIGTVAVRASPTILIRADIVKVVTTDSGRALYFSRSPIPFLRDTTDATLQSHLVRQHVGVYAYTRAALLRWVALPIHPLEQVERLEQLRPLAHGMHIAVGEVLTEPERGIDTEEDLVRANAHWATFAATAFSRAHSTPFPSKA